MSRRPSAHDLLSQRGLRRRVQLHVGTPANVRASGGKPGEAVGAMHAARDPENAGAPFERLLLLSETL